MPNSISVAAPKLGEWLKLERIRQNKSHGEVAQAVRYLVRETGLRVSKSQIVAIEKGRVPSWPLLAALARVYGTTLADLTTLLTDALEFPGAYDLLRQSQIAPLTDTETAAHAPHTLTTRVPDRSELFAELAKAADTFNALSLQCAEWRDRLIGLATDHGTGIVNGQTAGAGVHATGRIDDPGATSRSSSRLVKVKRNAS